jgi:hypothetical protein
MPKDKFGIKSDKVKIDKIITLSYELSDLDLDKLICRLQEIQIIRNNKASSDYTDTISL